MFGYWYPYGSPVQVTPPACEPNASQTSGQPWAEHHSVQQGRSLMASAMGISTVRFSSVDGRRDSHVIETGGGGAGGGGGERRRRRLENTCARTEIAGCEQPWVIT